jgi:hypothetical protein
VGAVDAASGRRCMHGLAGCQIAEWVKGRGKRDEGRNDEGRYQV